MTRRPLSLPMIGTDAWVRLPLKVRGESFRAVLDTGAFPELCVPHSWARSRKLVTGREPKLYRDGDAKNCMLRKPLRFSLGRYRFTAREVLAWERDGLRQAEAPITHLVGLRFILRFKTELDFKKRRVVFHPLASQPQRRWRRARAVPFQQVREDALLVAVAVDGASGWMMWDTGSTDLFVFPAGLTGRKASWARREPANMRGHGRMSYPLKARVKLAAAPVDVDLGMRRVVGLDQPAEQAADEQSVGRKLLGLMNVDLCGAARILIDPQRCVLWRAA